MVYHYSEEELPSLRCCLKLLLEIDAPPGEPPRIDDFADNGGVDGVLRPAEDIEGVGDMAVVKLNPVEGAETGASFRKTTFASWSRVSSLSIDVEDTFVGGAVESTVEASDG